MPSASFSSYPHPHSLTFTVNFFSCTHRLISTSPLELEKQLHLYIITPHVCSGYYHLLKLPIQSPQLWILILHSLWSQYHNAYFSEISSSFSTTLWSLSRSEAQKNCYKKSKLDKSSRGQASFAILYEWHSTILFHCYLCFNFAIPDCFTL